VKAVMPDVYKRLMRTPLVYDGRNIYEVEDMREAGVEYHSIGRASVNREAIKESMDDGLQTVR